MNIGGGGVTTGLTPDAAEAVAYRLVAEKLVRLYEELQEERDNLQTDLYTALAEADHLHAALEAAARAGCSVGGGGCAACVAKRALGRDVQCRDEKYDPDPDWRTD